MQSGIYVEYDSHFRWKTNDANRTFELLEKLLPRHSDRIVVGMDMAKNTYWKSYGGKPGLVYLLTEFREILEKKGMGKYFENLFFVNPQRLYAFAGMK
jgi:phosphotriesterase-related protein